MVFCSKEVISQKLSREEPHLWWCFMKWNSLKRPPSNCHTTTSSTIIKFSLTWLRVIWPRHSQTRPWPAITNVMSITRLPSDTWNSFFFRHPFVSNSITCLITTSFYDTTATPIYISIHVIGTHHLSEYIFSLFVMCFHWNIKQESNMIVSKLFSNMSPNYRFPPRISIFKGKKYLNSKIHI